MPMPRGYPHPAVVALTVAVLLGASATHAQSTAKRDIAAAKKHFERAYDHGDAAAVASLYTADGKVLPPGRAVVSGREAIRTFWDGAMKRGIKSVRLVTEELVAHGNAAHEVGEFTLLGADGRTIDSGKYIVIWRREGGHWKLQRDIWNTSRPAAAK